MENMVFGWFKVSIRVCLRNGSDGWVLFSKSSVSVQRSGSEIMQCLGGQASALPRLFPAFITKDGKPFVSLVWWVGAFKFRRRTCPDSNEYCDFGSMELRNRRCTSEMRLSEVLSIALPICDDWWCTLNPWKWIWTRSFPKLGKWGTRILLQLVFYGGYKQWNWFGKIGFYSGASESRKDGRAARLFKIFFTDKLLIFWAITWVKGQAILYKQSPLQAFSVNIRLTLRVN